VGCSGREGARSKQLEPQGNWVSVEDGVEMLSPSPCVLLSSSDGVESPNEVEIIHSAEGSKMRDRNSDSSSLSSNGKRPRVSDSAGTSSGCEHQNPADTLVTSCQHRICRHCLKSDVASIIENSMEMSELSYGCLRVQLLCPRCGLELSKTNLVELLDIDTVQNYENLLRIAYKNLYGPMVRPDMINCIRCQQKKAIVSMKMSSSKGKGKAKTSDAVNQFQNLSRDGNVHSLAFCVCTECDFSWCGACGSSNSQSEKKGRKSSHVCREAENYRIYAIMEDIESIHNEYTAGTVNSNEYATGTVNSNEYATGTVNSNEYTTGTVNSNEYPTGTVNSNEYPTGTVNSNEHATGTVISNDFAMATVSSNEYTPGTVNSNSNLSVAPHDIDHDWIATVSLGGYWSPLDRSNHGKKTVWSAGTGFGGCRSESSSDEKMRKVEKELDCRAKNVLASLADILNNKAMKQSYPFLGLSAYVLLSQENILSRLLEYFVINDSMLDICARNKLYHQLVSLLTVMKQYPDLLSILMGSCRESDTNGSSNHNIGSDSSLIGKMKNIYEQSKIIMRRFTGGNDDKNVEADVSIARCLLECYEGLAEAAQNQTSSIPQIISVSDGEDTEMTECSEATSDQSTSVSVEECSNDEACSNQYKNFLMYKNNLKPLQFQECSLISGFPRHTYSNNFTGSGANRQSIDNSGVHNKKRMMHITKEIASLLTSLPLEWESSIHVRVDSNRMDLLKALIVGPKGTPYQNGVFVFDIYLPPDYPQVPPMVTFLTTGCGSVLFNPNLYANGKVCLSLLGTWSGPGWQPGKSTLLQVLVSIQSLIFVEYPFYNEPGRENMTNSLDSAERENRTQRYNTLKFAILDALRYPDSSFKDLIVAHFQHKRDEITGQCNEWMKANGVHKNKHGNIDKIAEEVILELVKLPSLPGSDLM